MKQGKIMCKAVTAGFLLAAAWGCVRDLPAAEIPMGAAGDGTVRLVAGPERTALIELFTSEGCSSCPPAEQWLSGLRTEPRLWRDFVPISFHVNYWDNLGWRDRFATRAFTDRQYALAQAWGSGSVYTPCFVRDGGEWRPRGRLPSERGEATGTLVVDVGADGICRVEFSPVRPERRARYDVHLALLGGGYVSRVTAGENRGATLTHEFVALGLAETALVAVDSAPGVYHGQAARPSAAADGAGSDRLALAAWVTRRGELEPLQAAGGWLSP
jgi:hypothetical protein